MEQRTISKETLKRAAFVMLQYWRSGENSFLDLHIHLCKKLSQQAFNNSYEGFLLLSEVIEKMTLSHYKKYGNTYDFPYKKLFKAVELIGFKLVDEIEL